LIDLDVRYGTRTTAKVLLDAECLGTMSDLAGARTCTHTASELRDTERLATTDGIDTPHDSHLGSWKGAQKPGCRTAPRSGALDAEACVSGGAFLFGSDENFELSLESSVPEQPVSVAPFLIDRYEMTVGRFRAALAAGFVPPDATYTANDGTIRLTTETKT